MKIWFDPNGPEPDSDWVWCKAERRAMNWIAAEPRIISIPKDKSFDHIADAAKSQKVKCLRHG